MSRGILISGEVRERLNRAVSKTVEPKGSEGSNPSLSAIQLAPAAAQQQFATRPIASRKFVRSRFGAKGILGFLVVLFGIFGGSRAVAEFRWQAIPEGELQRIAFGSCLKQWEPQPIWRVVAATEPDLFLLLGDNIYADYDGSKTYTPTRKSLQSDWKRLLANPDFSAVRARVPFLATWDNHDYGKHDGGAAFSLKDVSKALFLDTFGEPPDGARRTRAGIYDARIFGPEGRRVQVILLDNRWFRSPLIPDQRTEVERRAQGIVGSMGHTPNRNPDATLLGEPQWRWLATQLEYDADLRLIVSGTQIIPDQKGMQEWGNFPLERERLFNLIQSSGAGNVLLLSGNVHYAELSRIRLVRGTLYEFTSSGMTHVSPRYAKVPNPYRVGAPFVDHNFGLIEIDWNAQPSPTVTLSAMGRRGNVGFSHRFALDPLIKQQP